MTSLPESRNRCVTTSVSMIRVPQATGAPTCVTAFPLTEFPYLKKGPEGYSMQRPSEITTPFPEINHYREKCSRKYSGITINYSSEFQNEEPILDINNFNSISKVFRITPWIRRFINSMKLVKKDRIKTPLTA
ncbi:hypothetical protein TNCV_1022871 [Trichonephila clavipes]|nr:hypothetical protein TNCV_1022871 [Trichonephila clavipes]